MQLFALEDRGLYFSGDIQKRDVTGRNTEKRHSSVSTCAGPSKSQALSVSFSPRARYPALTPDSYFDICVLREKEPSFASDENPQNVAFFVETRCGQPGRSP